MVTDDCTIMRLHWNHFDSFLHELTALCQNKDVLFRADLVFSSKAIRIFHTLVHHPTKIQSSTGSNLSLKTFGYKSFHYTASSIWNLFPSVWDNSAQFVSVKSQFSILIWYIFALLECTVCDFVAEATKVVCNRLLGYEFKSCPSLKSIQCISFCEKNFTKLFSCIQKI